MIREMGEEIRGVKYVYCDKFVLFRMLVRRYITRARFLNEGDRTGRKITDHD